MDGVIGNVLGLLQGQCLHTAAQERVPLPWNIFPSFGSTGALSPALGPAGGCRTAGNGGEVLRKCLRNAGVLGGKAGVSCGILVPDGLLLSQAGDSLSLCSTMTSLSGGS